MQIFTHLKIGNKMKNSLELLPILLFCCLWIQVHNELDQVGYYSEYLAFVRYPVKFTLIFQLMKNRREMEFQIGGK